MLDVRCRTLDVESNFLIPVRIDVLSLFPAIATATLGESMMKRAQERGLFTFKSHDLRDWTHDKHRTADDAPYGGGQGMVMKCEPIFEAVESLRTPQTRVVFMGPCGRRLDQRIAQEYASLASSGAAPAGPAEKGAHLIILCGHYEGVDQRVLDHLVDDEISIGDYVLTNGVIAAVVFVDAIVRLIPGVLGDDASAADDSFATGLLEFPHYTRPPEFRGWKIPDILLSGNHAAIERWRREQALERTRQRRPDLLPPEKS